MAEHQWSPEELQALVALGLSITSHSDLNHGWGYTWQGRDWVGPFTTPAAALYAAFTEALLALQFRSNYSWVQFAKSCDLWRSDGGGEGWRRVGESGTEDDEQALVQAGVHPFQTPPNNLPATQPQKNSNPPAH